MTEGGGVLRFKRDAGRDLSLRAISNQERLWRGVPPSQFSRREISKDALLHLLRQHTFGKCRVTVVEVSS